MNRLLPKILTFSTFLGSCAIVGLILSSLVSNCWISSDVTFISTPGNANQYGMIQFGLFNYQKALNHGYGLRHDNFSVLNILKTEFDFMSYELWLMTVLSTVLSLFASIFAAIASVIGTIRKNGGVAMMIVPNTVSGFGQLFAIVCWVLQYFQYLQHNVLLKEEQKKWTSRGKSTLGYSFFFVVAAFFFVILNLFLLVLAIKIEKRYKKSSAPLEKEESNSIMLY